MVHNLSDAIKQLLLGQGWVIDGHGQGDDSLACVTIKGTLSDATAVSNNALTSKLDVL